jgi:uncharacterized protein
MVSGLLALLDDVSALVKVGAASLDDVSAQVVKTSGKVSGIVIDDAAVTPKYVVGLDPSRELAIIYAIAKKSLVNKLVFLGPAALLLGFFAPWLITPILMVGGAYLCFEGYEKVHAIFAPKHRDATSVEASAVPITPQELEKMRVSGAVRTDFILSAEIMAIAYATVASNPLVTQIMVMLAVAIGITIAVYGFVGIVVKADDVGLHLAKTSPVVAVRAVGRGIVKGMPAFLTVLGYIGTAAMLWVGAEIIAHGIPVLHHALESLSQSMSAMPILGWFAKVALLSLGGLALGGVIAQGVWVVSKIIKK